MLPTALLAATLAQPDLDRLNIGDQIILNVTITAAIDFNKLLQWRNYDLQCRQKTASEMQCVVVGKREPA